MLKFSLFFQLILFSISICGTKAGIVPFRDEVVTMDTFVYWPNATVPFYINPSHFDQEQAQVIMTSLAMFSQKTCIKFMPVMSAPHDDHHVMTFVNPDGVKGCRVDSREHSNFGPHIIPLGYGCLKSPEIDMIVMRALGVPFEHNRMSRDVFIDVVFENIEPRYHILFTKSSMLPNILRAIPYDINSVMHFGERDYSKNGHRTIIFKHPNMHQQRNGLTPSDIKKLDLIYGPHCQARDRAEKYIMCRDFPGLGRRKRQIKEIKEPLGNISLRVNPNITPPPEFFAGITNKLNNDTSQSSAKVVADYGSTKNVTENLNTLNITEESDTIVELINQLFSLVLKEAREKFCNRTASTNVTSEIDFKYDNNNASEFLSMVKFVTRFANKIYEDVVRNSTEFCQNSKTLEAFQSQCKENNDSRCSFSSESGPVKNLTENTDADKQMKDNKNITANDDKNITAGDDKNITADDDKNITADDDKNVTANDDKNITANDDKNIIADDDKNVTADDDKNTKADDNKNITVNDDKNITADDDKNITADKNTDTALKLNRRKREATIDVTTLESSEAITDSTTSVSTEKPSEAIKKVKTTVSAPTSLETDKSNTTVITLKSLAAVSKSSTDTAPIAESVMNAVSAPKPLPAVSKPSRTTPPKTEAVMRAVNAPESSETVNKLSATVNTLKTTESNLKEKIKAMRAERLQEIKNTNFTEPSQLISKKDSKLKTNKTIPSRSKLKSLRKEKIKKVLRANSTAKEEAKTDSEFKKDTVDSPSSRVDTRRKKSRLIEMQRAMKLPKVKEDREVFRRVSMENRLIGRTIEESSESESDESAISIEVQKEPASVEVRIVTESNKDVKSTDDEESTESKEVKKEKSKTHTKGKHKKVEESEFKHKKVDELNSKHKKVVDLMSKHKKVDESDLKHKKLESSSSESSSDETEENLQKKLALIKKNGEKFELPKTVKLSKLNKEFYDERKWPDGEVIYVIKKLPDYGEEDLNDLRYRLAAVNKILTNKTCVSIREVDADEAEGFEDYLVIDNSPDFVTGRVGGKQIFGAVELFKGRQPRQHAAMMVMAMLGFYFEVSRHDRDMYIRVHNRNIRPDKLHHFEKLREEATLDLPYDYKSATHPSALFWRKLGRLGISSLATYKRRDPRGIVMRALGEHPKILSDIDIIKINSVYGVKCFLEPEETRSNKNKKYRSRSENMNVIQ